MLAGYRFALGVLLVFAPTLVFDSHSQPAPPTTHPTAVEPQSAFSKVDPGLPSQGCAGDTRAIVSPDDSWMACGGECPPAAKSHDTTVPCLAIFDGAGKPILRSSSLDDPKLGTSCSPGQVQWLDDQYVGLPCVYEPLLSQYLVVNARSGSIEQRYTGIIFGWSPDRKTLARVDIARNFGTPQGTNSCLYLDSRAVYPAAHPKDCNPRPRDIYDGIHTFLTKPVWSPDSRRVAIVSRIFDWEYEDIFGRYWEGTLSNDRYFLVIASLDQPTGGYVLETPSLSPNLQWIDNSHVALDGQTFDLTAQPPRPIP